jgi:hypothetical protein
MRSPPTGSRSLGRGPAILGRFGQRSQVLARPANWYIWILVLIGVTAFHKVRAQEPGDPPPASFQTRVVQGIVAQYLMNPDGFVDGLLLSNNIIIRFPPHLGQVLTQTVSPQDVVRVEGFFESSGTFHASSIVDLQSQRSVACTPPSPGHPPPPHPGSLPRRPLSANGTIRVHTQGRRESVADLALYPDSRDAADSDLEKKALAAAKMVIDKTAIDSSNDWQTAYRNVVTAVGRRYKKYGQHTIVVERGEGASERTKFTELLQRITMINEIGGIAMSLGDFGKKVLKSIP